MTVTIKLSDEQAAALKVKAAAQGLTLEGWFQKLAQQRLANGPRPPDLEPAGAGGSTVVEEMRKIRARVKPDPEGWTTRDYVNYGRR